MKNILIAFACVLVLPLMSGSAFAVSYEFDFNGDGVWDTEWALYPGMSATLEVWLDGYTCEPYDDIFGAELYFQYDHTMITVNESNSYPWDIPHGGPFDEYLSFFKYKEDGVYALTVSQFVYTRVTDNKIKLGVIELQCIAEGVAFIKAANNLGFGGYTDGFVSDCNLDNQYPEAADATVHPPPCEINISPQSATVDGMQVVPFISTLLLPGIAPHRMTMCFQITVIQEMLIL